MATQGVQMKFQGVQNAMFYENPHENERIWVILGCAISSIARAKHGCTGGWLKLWKDFVRNVHLEDVWANTGGPLLFTCFGGRRKCGVWWAIMPWFQGPARWECWFIIMIWALVCDSMYRYGRHFGSFYRNHGATYVHVPPCRNPAILETVFDCLGQHSES